MYFRALPCSVRQVRRLGLSSEREALVRGAFAREPGMLVVDTVIAGGPASGVLKPGDVLVRINGSLCTHFIPLEEILDNTIAVKQALLGEASEVGMWNRESSRSSSGSDDSGREAIGSSDVSVLPVAAGEAAVEHATIPVEIVEASGTWRCRPRHLSGCVLVPVPPRTICA